VLHLLTRVARLDEITPNKLPRRTAINGSSGKRKGHFDTPATTKVSRPESNGTPGTFKAPNRGDLQDGLKYAALLSSHTRCSLISAQSCSFLGKTKCRTDRRDTERPFAGGRSTNCPLCRTKNQICFEHRHQKVFIQAHGNAPLRILRNP